MKKIIVKNAAELFPKKEIALNKLNDIRHIIDMIFSAVQNDGTVITEKNIQDILVQLDNMERAFEDIDNVLNELADGIALNGVIDEG